MRQSVGELLTFGALYQSERICVLMDTGAQVSIVSQAMANILREPTIDVSVSVNWINNQNIRLTKAVRNLVIEIQDRKFELGPCLVAPLCNFDVIIGSKTQSDLQTVIDQGRRIVSMRDVTGSMVELKPAKYRVPTSLSNSAIVGYCTATQADKWIRNGCEWGYVIVSPINTIVQSDAEFRKAVEKAISPDCPAAEKRKLIELIMMYKDVFAEPTGVPAPSPFDLRLRLKPGAQPVRTNPYKLGEPEMKELTKRVTQMLEYGWIVPSASPWASPVIFVRKPDGTFRLVLDYRALNERTESDAAPLPRVDSLLESLSGSRVFSKMDLASGFHQMRLHPDTAEYTSFTTPLGSYQWTVLPMGLKQSPAVFMKYMSSKFSDFSVRKELALYIDDLLWHTDTHLTHLELLKRVFDRMRETNLKAKISKCLFMANSVAFLGHTVSAAGITPSHDKVRSIREWPVPTTPAALHSFLGLCGYLRSYIYKYSDRCRPLQECLTQALREMPKSHLLGDLWTSDCQTAFEDLKAALTKEVILPFFDPKRQTAVWCDSSGYALGGVLLQRNEKGKLQPIAYHSRKLRPNEIAWDTRDKELQAALDCLSVWRHYLLSTSQPFYLITDHASLRNWATTRVQHARLTRMLLKLQDYDFIPVYKRGSQNVVADALSRREDYEKDFLSQAKTLDLPFKSTAVQTDTRSLLVGTVTPVTDFTGAFPEDTLSAIRHGYELMTHDEVERLGLYELDGLLLTKSGRLYVHSDAARVNLVTHAHSRYAHEGIKKCAARLKAVVWWPYLHQTVQSVIRACDTCQRAKSVTRPLHAPLQPMFGSDKSDHPTRPFEVIALDFVWGLRNANGKTGFLTLLDLFSKYVIAIPVHPQINSKSVAQLIIDRWIQYFGVPRRLVSDNDVRFVSQTWMDTLQSWRTSHSKSTVYYPRSNGAVERVQATIVSMLRACEIDGISWVEALPKVCHSINSSIHSATKFTPHQLVFGMEVHDIAMDDAMDESDRVHTLKHYRELAAKSLEEAAKISMMQDNGQDTSDWLKIGNKVLLKTSKLKLTKGIGVKLVPKYVGPFEITKVYNDRSVELDFPSHFQVRKRWNCSYLRPYISDVSLPISDTTPFGFNLSDLVEDEELDKISNESQVKKPVELYFENVKKGIRWYKVRFEGETWGDCEILSEDTIKSLPNGVKLLEDQLRSSRHRN